MMSITKLTNKRGPKPRQRSNSSNTYRFSDFNELKDWFRTEASQKDISDIMISYVKEIYPAKDSEMILKNPSWVFYYQSHYAAAIQWTKMGNEFPPGYESYPMYIKQYFDGLIKGKTKTQDLNLDSSNESDNTTSTASRPIIKKEILPSDALHQKIQDTIMTDIDGMIDDWIMGKKTELDIPKLFQAHDLKPSAVPTVRNRLLKMQIEYEDAYNRVDEQLVEAYSHIGRVELRRQMNAVKNMIESLNNIKQIISKTPKKVPKKSSNSIQSQLKKVKTKLKSDYGIECINPIGIIGASTAYLFNEKYRILSEIHSLQGGFFIKGTTIQNIDFTKSKCTKLRKPEAFISIVKSKTVAQIQKEWSKLSTRSMEATGRLSEETIIVRIIK
jgi:hypothetical protein